jgi:hypothetical protein
MEETELETARRRVIQGRRAVAAQRDKVARLKAEGRDIQATQRQLEIYETSQATFEEHLAMLQTPPHSWDLSPGTHPPRR